MPKLGEIRQAREIYTFKERKAGQNKHIWVACETCGRERWVVLVKNQPKSLRCRICTAKENLGRIRNKHPSWKGGRNLDSDGYILVKIYPEDFFYSMVSAASQGYIREHRLVMAKHLGRCLQRWEVVHHRGIEYPQGSKENRADNRIENLELGTQGNHMIEHDKGYKDGFRQGYLAGKTLALKE